MSNVCRYCGAKLDSSAKICTNCGKVVPAFNQNAQKEGYNQFGTPERSKSTIRDTVKTPYAATRSARQMQAPDEKYGTSTLRRQPDPGYDPVKAAAQKKVPFVTNASSGKQAHAGVLGPLLGKLIKIVLVLAVILVLFAVVRVLMVRQAKYDFKLPEQIKLESTTYGEAFGKFFKEGKWWYDIKKNAVTYKGTGYDNKEYDMVFGRVDGQTAVKSLTIDGKIIDSKDDNIMKNYVMGMFMAQRVTSEKAKAFG